MSNLTEFAERELRAAGLDKPDSDYGGMLYDAVRDLIKVFAEQGHSGFSASLTVRLFSKVAMFEPLVPLTGEDSEWTHVGTGLFQNKRCSHVFKENGVAYDQEGRIFREPSGVCYTSVDSRVPLTFPYTPHSEYVDVDAQL